MSSPGGIGNRRAAPGGERVGAVLAGHPERSLDGGVVRFEVGVPQRPVRHRRAVDRATRRVEVEVLLPEAGELGVGVHPAAADGRRQVVDLTGEQALAVAGRSAVGAWLEARVGAEQVAARQSDLVVGEVAQRLVRCLEVDQVVAALLQDDHRPPGGREHLGGGRPARTRADDDGVAVGHVSRAGGNRGSGKSMRFQPPPRSVAAVGGVAVRGLAGVGVHDATVGIGGRARDDALVHGAQLRDALGPRVSLPRPQVEPAGSVARPRAGRRPDPWRVVVHRGQERLDVVDGPQRRGPRHLLVEGGSDGRSGRRVEHRQGLSRMKR